MDGEGRRRFYLYPGENAEKSEAKDAIKICLLNKNAEAGLRPAPAERGRRAVSPFFIY
jgi:hypothetical protein